MDWELIRYIAYAIICLVFMYIFARQKFMELINSAIINSKRWAKEELKKGIEKTGDEQIEFACKNFYPLLPAVVKKFISEDKFRNIVKFSYKKLKDYIDDGKINGSNG